MAYPNKFNLVCVESYIRSCLALSDRNKPRPLELLLKMRHYKKGIEGTYNLHNYEAECAEWLQKWADYLDGIKKS